MDDFNFGENLRKIRESKGISQEAISMALNISQSTYSRIERGLIAPSDEKVSQIAKLLNVSLADLLGPNAPSTTILVGLEPKFPMKSFLNTNYGMLVAWASGTFLTVTAHDITQEAFNTGDITQTTMVTAKWTAALLTAGSIWYWVRKIKRGK